MAVKQFPVHSGHVIEITTWCVDTFGPSYTMPNWWRIEKQPQDLPLAFIVEFFNEDDAVLYALRWT